jgi:glycine cleavage system aminomethyltransferase T
MWSNNQKNTKMEKATFITFENYKQFVGKKVEVEICCDEAGMMYPDNNILVGMNDDYFYFMSEQGTEDECMWHWEVKEEKEKGKLNCSIQVWHCAE